MKRRQFLQACAIAVAAPVLPAVSAPLLTGFDPLLREWRESMWYTARYTYAVSPEVNGMKLKMYSKFPTFRHLVDDCERIMREENVDRVSWNISSGNLGPMGQGFCTTGALTVCFVDGSELVPGLSYDRKDVP